MKQVWWLAALVMAVGLFAAPSAHAGDGNFAVQGDWGSNDVDFGVGGRLFFDVGRRHDGFGGIASFDYFFPNVGSYWEINGNVAYTLSGDLQPYIGGGLVLAHSSNNGEGDSTLGLNLLGGLRLSHRVFAEGRVELRDGGPAVLTVGVLL